MSTLADLDREIREREERLSRVRAEHEEVEVQKRLSSSDPIAVQHRVIQDALKAGLDILHARRANLKAGVPEGLGIAPAADINGLVKKIVAKEAVGISKALGKVLGDFRKEVVDPLLERVAAVEQRGDGVRYRGVFQKALSYKRGEFCSHEGAMWFCCKDTQTKPGTNDDWQLAVKAGRDGRDAERTPSGAPR